MQAITLDLNPCRDQSEENLLAADITFSLKPFIDFIAQKVRTEKTSKLNLYRYIQDQFNYCPELNEPLLPENAKQYCTLFELIYNSLSPILSDEKEQYWALSKPVLPHIYFGTNAIYDVLMDAATCELKSNLKMPSQGELRKTVLLNFYDLILNKYYNISLRTGQININSIVDSETNLLKYYRLNVDTRFLNIKNKFELPEFSLQDIKDYGHDESYTLRVLMAVLPPEHFSIEGISVITLTDVTREHAIEAVKNVIIEHKECNIGCHADNLSVALKTLVGSDKIKFGLLPYIKMNEKMIMHDHSGFESIVVKLAKKEKIDYQRLLDNYIVDPRRLVFPEIAALDQSNSPVLQLLWRNGIKSYALLPLNYSGKLVGGLELYTTESNAFNGHILSNIDPAMSLLAQLFHNIITDFNNELINVITDKFTALQPSVQWRFNQAAYNYILLGEVYGSQQMERISFNNVHPLYGAVDIKNSSIERNLVIRKDLYAHFEILEETLKGIKKSVSSAVMDDIPSHATIWGYKEFQELSDREILKIEDYLLRQLPPYLTLLKNAHPEVQQLIADYFEKTKENGLIYENRNKYEESMQQINRAVTNHLDEFNTDLQQVYPCYFEKFRTDGVEFDIYLGQSIAPENIMPENMLQVFRLKQLELLAKTARTTYGLMPDLSLPLETTQLIFVYEKEIDISFRTDEQRFDVEGSYNIRYQMVKKRIDKAHVKNSQERLTQFGKIAIVYFNSWEAQEYLEYIKVLQQQDLLNDEIEFIEIEELQGVEGLKALRVNVKM